MSTFVHADPVEQAGFTIIPNAVLRNPNLSFGAKTVYGVIKSHAWKVDSAVPGQQRIAEFLGVTPETVRKYVKELVDAKLVKVIRRGQGRTNQYVVLPLTPANSSVLDDDVRRGLDDDAALHEVDEVEEDEVKDLDLSPAAPSKEERDAVWDALKAVFGNPTTPQHRSRFGRVQKELMADSSLTPGQVAAEIVVRANNYRTKWPAADLTLEAFAKHWPDLGTVTARPNMKYGRRSVSAQELLDLSARLRAEGEPERRELASG